MYVKNFSLRIGLFGLIALFSCASNAQTTTYDILLDIDQNVNTGCSVTPTGQATVSGIERRVQAVVDSSTLMVTEVNIARCDGIDFGLPVIVGGPHPVGLNNGINGTDVIELSSALFDLQPLTNGVIEVTVVGADATGSDLLSTTDGSVGGNPILIFIPIAVPALGILGLLLLIAAITIIALRGRQRHWLSISLLAASGIVFAASFIVDGDVTDWGGVNPDATDPANDSTNGSSGNDLQALFIAQENETFFFRLDVTDLENAAPTALDDTFNVLEDNALNEVAPGVLGNDTDPDMDPLTANLITGPTNALAFTLNADGSFDYTPNADFFGTDTFTYVANDGSSDSDPATATITIDSVNDAPSFNIQADTTVDENVPAQSLAGFASNILAGPANESGQVLTFNITGNDNAALFSAAPALTSDGTLTFTPETGTSGVANITVELMDDGGVANGGVDTSTTQAFVINVTSVNDAPTFTGGPDQTVSEDAGPQSITPWATAVSAGPPDEAGQVLTFNVTANDNAALFVAGPAVAADGTLTFTPAADINGTANITIELMDDGGTANGGVDTSTPFSFVINVTAVNDVPVFALGANPTVLEDAGAQTINAFATGISAGPVDENGQALTFNITANDNAALFSTAPALDPITGNLTFTPTDDAVGVANVTVELMDDGGTADGGVDTSAGQTFVISVTAVNDAPIFTPGPAQTVLEDAGAQTVAWATGISAGPADEVGQTLTFNVTGNDNAALFAVTPTIDAAGMLSYTPADDANGAANITINLSDDGGTADGGVDTSAPITFSITVTAVNDAPEFTVGTPPAALEDAGAQTVAAFATGLSAGPTDENGQALTFNITNNTNPALFSAAVALNPTTGDLTYTAADNAAGTADITVTLSDDGGTANGGVDTSAGQTFTITITPVNDQPVFTIAGNPPAINEDAGAQSIAAFVTGIDDGDPDQVQTVSLNLVPQAGGSASLTFAAAPAISPVGVLTYTPADNAFGTVSFNVTLVDDGGTANGGIDTSVTQAFTITVNGINDPPTIGAAPTLAATTNIQISAPAASGLLAGASDDPLEVLAGSVLTVGNGANPNPTTTAGGGNVSINAADGSFTYSAPAGMDSGSDTFQYVICDNGLPAPGICSAAITATINLSGNTVWFIDAGATVGGTGRQSDPFNSIAAFNAQQGGGGTSNPAAGDFIFMFTGNYTGSFALLNNQTLFGQGTTGIGFDAFTGITPSAVSTARPALAGADPVITTTAAASNAINVAATSTIRGLNIGNTTGFGIAGTSAGTLAISQVDIIGTGGLLDIDGGGTGTLGAALGALTSTISNVPNVIDIQNYALGDLTATSTSIQNPNQAGFLLQNNAGASVLDFGDFATLVTTNGAGFVVNNSGTVTISPPVPVSVLTVGGPALDLTNTTFNGFILSILSANNTTTGVILNNVSGLISSGGGTIQNTTGDAFVVTGGSSGVNYSGTITNTAGRALAVTGHTGGIVTFSSINDTAQGIFLNNNAGTTFFFADTMILNTGANNAFTATNGGTIDATGTGSTITTTTGTAININGVNIRNTGFNVQSVSSNGSASAINMVNSNGAGSLNVTGDGSNTQNGSGGTIQNTTSHAVLINNSSNISLNSVNITGPGNSNAEHGVFATNLRGSNFIRGTVFSGQNNTNGDYIRVDNDTQNLTLLEVNSSLFTGVNGLGNDGILFDISGTVTARLDVLNNNHFDGLSSDGVQVIADNQSNVTTNINGNRFSNDSGIQAANASRLTLGTSDALLVNGGALAATVTNNTILDTGVQNGGGIPVGIVGIIDLLNNQAGGSTIAVSGNNIDDIEQDIATRFVGDDNTALLTVLVDNNDIDNIPSGGITFNPRDDSLGTDLTVRNNRLGMVTAVGVEGGIAEDSVRIFVDDQAAGSDVFFEDNTIIGSSSSQVIDADFESSSSNITLHGNTITNAGDSGEAIDIEADNTGALCLDMNADNIAADANTFTDGPNTGDSEIHRESDAGAYGIEDLGATVTPAAIIAFLNARNNFNANGGGAGTLEVNNETNFSSTGDCVLPATP